jgi:signal transduction histidine kinase
MLSLRAHLPDAASRVPWARLRRPFAAIAVAMAGGAALAAVWSLGPGVVALVIVAVGVVAVGWAALNLLTPALEGDAAAREEAEQLRAFREEIVTTVSHELRTPLTVIQGLTSVLNTRWDVLPETRKLDLIDSINLNVSSLDASILHFVDAGRLVRGEYTLTLALITLKDVTDPVLAKLAGVLAGHELQVDLPDEPVWADAEALGRILELLLANAARFSPLSTRITVRATRGVDASLVLSVGDRGAGIAPQHLPYVFDPFWRGDVSETGVSRGAGLGLFIVKELVDRHGGTVKINSAKGRGTTVAVSLPAAPPDVVDTLAASSPPAQARAAYVAPQRASRPARPGRVRLQRSKRGAVDRMLGGD